MIDSIANDKISIQRAAELIRQSRYAVALTGAGFSTPSGIPDFRSEGSGLWTRYLPMEVASLTTFRVNPDLFFAWLRPLASHMLLAQPNPAHIALAHLEKAGHLKSVITQNIDGLHHRAGSTSVFEIHGTFSTMSCSGCFQQVPASPYIEPYINLGKIPHCPQCNRVLKPDVILFEEQLPYKIWQKAEQAANHCDLMLVAGTSLEVLPSAKLPLLAVENGARLIIVNQSDTYIDVRADLILRGNVAEIIPLVVNGVVGD
jgi:NAD-dependent deacetylase